MLAMREWRYPADAQSRNAAGRTAMELVPLKSKPADINVTLSNSFGFGGTNASLVFRRYDA